MTEDDPPRSDTLPPGYDEQAPYRDEDLTEYPDWWQRNVKEFAAHEMRPYRPPRFADGVVTTVVIEGLERRLGERVRIRAVDPQDGGHWEVVVGDTTAGTIDRVRTKAGNSEYDVTSDTFESLVLDALDSDQRP